MALKKVRIIYSAKNFTTGLSDVKANIYINQVAKAVGVSAVALTELDATNAPGLYYAEILPATLAGYGAVAGDALEARINSASFSAPAAYKETLSGISTDDIDAKLGTPAGASVSADIASIKSELDTVNTNAAAIKADVEDATNGLPAIKTAVNGVQTTASAIKADVEDATNGLAAIKTAVTALSSQVSSIQNNTNFEAFVPQNLVKPTSGSTTFRVVMNVQNEHGSVADPDSNAITVSLTNSAGTDRSSMLVGVSGTTAPAVRDAAGKYHIDVTVASGSTEEELVFGFDYTISAAAYSKRRVGLVTNNVQADGFAQQTTLLAVQTTATDTNTRVTDIQSKVNDTTIGLSNIESLVFAAKADLENGTFGLAQLQALLANGTYGLSALQSILANGTYGLSALQSILANGTYGLAAANTLQNTINTNTLANGTNLGLIEGSGFATLTDSLAAISARVYTGGRAV